MKRLFNPGMLLCWVLCGCFFIGGLGVIKDAWNHHGPGEVLYGPEGGYSAKAPEAKYKRYEYVGGGLLIAVGVYCGVLGSQKRPEGDR